MIATTKRMRAESQLLTWLHDHVMSRALGPSHDREEPSKVSTPQHPEGHFLPCDEAATYP